MIHCQDCDEIREFSPYEKCDNHQSPYDSYNDEDEYYEDHP